MKTSHILFSLYRWKSKSKDLELIVSLPTNDSFGMYDYYTIYFVINKIDKGGEEYNKILSQHTNRRFGDYCSKDYFAFSNTISYNSEAIRNFKDFHYSKIDIQGLKVLKVV